MVYEPISLNKLLPNTARSSMSYKDNKGRHPSLRRAPIPTSVISGDATNAIIIVIVNS